MKMKQVLSLDTKTNISRKSNKQSGDLSLLEFGLLMIVEVVINVVGSLPKPN